MKLTIKISFLITGFWFVVTVCAPAQVVTLDARTEEQHRMNNMSQAFETVAPVVADQVGPAMRGDKVNVFYGAKQALFEVSLDIQRNQVTSLIGPSGCGKSTFLRTLNRMNDTIESCRVEGKITLEGRDITHTGPGTFHRGRRPLV